MLFATSGGSAVVLNGKVYIGGVGADSEDEEYFVQVYSPEKGEWSYLEKCPVRFFSLTTLNEQLVIAGGLTQKEGYTPSPIVLVWNSSLERWTPRYPEMPTARMLPAAIGYQQYLAVAGGYTMDTVLDIVEVLNTVSEQWFAANPLPFCTRQPTVTVIGETLYLLGGKSSNSPSKSVFSISLPDLVSLRTCLPGRSTLWKALPDAPLVWPTAASIGNSLVVVGGRGENDSPQSAIFYYNSSSRMWSTVGDVLPKALSSCTCATLPSGELFVAGGCGSEGVLSNAVFVATVGK